MRKKKFRYFAPNTHVWIYTDGNGREKGVVVQRQSGVYRVKFESDGHVEMRNTKDVSERRE